MGNGVFWAVFDRYILHNMLAYKKYFSFSKDVHEIIICLLKNTDGEWCMSYEYLSKTGFIDEFIDVSKGPHCSKFCFVLGAGASKSSGIKMGQELVDRWDEELRKRNPQDYSEWIKELGITEDNKYNFYSQYYEKRFYKRPKDGLNYLEKIMEHVTPGVGYVVLAHILTNTNHNVVITTNFDHLVEDAVTYYSQVIPLIIGHESLAHYISEQVTRPTIVKIHRDLLFDPKNTTDEVEQLHDSWKKALGMIFSEYHPVFIGYAGNDNSLMDFLIDNGVKFKNKEWKFPYWTLYKSDTPDGKVKKFLDAAEGYCISCNGFDELMCLIGKETGYKLPIEEEFLKDAKGRYKKLSEDFENFTRISVQNSEKGEMDGNSLQEALQTFGNQKSSISRSVNLVLAYNQGKYEEALSLCRELVENEPENAKYKDLLSIILHGMEEYEEARNEAEKAVKLEPENARYRNSLGTTLHEMGKYEEARKEKEKAVELEPENAEYRSSLGITLHEMGEYEEARKEKEKAVELKPENARYRNNFGATLHAMGEYEEARKEVEKSVELEPENTEYRDNLVLILEKLKL